MAINMYSKPFYKGFKTHSAARAGAGIVTHGQGILGFRHWGDVTLTFNPETLNLEILNAKP